MKSRGNCFGCYEGTLSFLSLIPNLIEYLLERLLECYICVLFRSVAYGVDLSAVGQSPLEINYNDEQSQPWLLVIHQRDSCEVEHVARLQIRPKLCLKRDRISDTT